MARPGPGPGPGPITALKMKSGTTRIPKQGPGAATSENKENKLKKFLKISISLHFFQDLQPLFLDWELNSKNIKKKVRKINKDEALSFAFISNSNPWDFRKEFNWEINLLFWLFSWNSSKQEMHRCQEIISFTWF